MGAYFSHVTLLCDLPSSLLLSTIPVSNDQYFPPDLRDVSFLASTYEWEHTELTFLSLGYFT